MAETERVAAWKQNALVLLPVAVLAVGGLVAWAVQSGRFESDLCDRHRALARADGFEERERLKDEIEAHVLGLVSFDRLAGNIPQFDCPECDDLADRAIEMGD